MPDFTDYHMAGRTYRYVEAAPWYPFGYGLSYSEFSYDNIWAKPQENGVDVHVRVTNEGTMDGGEITQLYIRYEGEAFEKPHHKLAAFERTVLKAGEGKELVFCLTSKDFLSVKEDGENVLYEGVYTIFVGGSQPDERSVALMKKMPLAVGIRVKGETFAAEGGGRGQALPLSRPKRLCCESGGAEKVGTSHAVMRDFRGRTGGRDFNGRDTHAEGRASTCDAERPGDEFEGHGENVRRRVWAGTHGFPGDKIVRIE